MTDVKVKELEPDALVVLEDMVTLLAVMVKAGVGAGADEPKTTELSVKRNPGTASRRYLGIAETFPRWIAPRIESLDRSQFQQLLDFLRALCLIPQTLPVFKNDLQASTVRLSCPQAA